MIAGAVGKAACDASFFFKKVLQLICKFWDLADLSSRLEGGRVAVGVAAAGVTGRADRQECWADRQECVGKRKGGRGTSRGFHRDSLAHHSVSSNEREGEDQGQHGIWGCRWVVGRVRQANYKGSSASVIARGVGNRVQVNSSLAPGIAAGLGGVWQVNRNGTWLGGRQTAC